MPSLLVRLILCLTSYLPLTVIFAVQYYFNKKYITAVLLLVIGIVGLIITEMYLLTAKRLNPRSMSIQSMNKRDGEVMSYIVSYLLPFIALPSGSLADKISLGIFLIVLIVLYINSDMLHINPILSLTGWHVYDVSLTNGENYILLSRRAARKGREMKVINVCEDILMEVK